MKLVHAFLCFPILMMGCQPKVDNTAKEAFEKNSKTVLSYIDGFQKESLDYDALYSKEVNRLGTSYGSQDTANLDEIKASNEKMWGLADFEMVTTDLSLLPGVSADTKQMDGSVRYYADWKVTIPATDSTEARSGVLRTYQSFDFDADGKIWYQQFYGDTGGLFNYLLGKD